MCIPHLKFYSNNFCNGSTGFYTALDITNITGSIYTWSGTNLTVNGTNNTAYATSTNQGNGAVTVSIYSPKSKTTIISKKNVCIGAPSQPYDISGFPNDGLQFPSNSYFNFIAWTQPYEQGANSCEWYVIGGTILSGQSTPQIDVLTDNATNGNNIAFVVGARFGNSCGWSPWLSRSGVVYDNGGGGGSTYSVYPNPVSTEVTVSVLESGAKNNDKDIDDCVIRTIRIFDKTGLCSTRKIT